MKINSEALLNAKHFLHSLPVSMHTLSSCLNAFKHEDIIIVLQLNHWNTEGREHAYIGWG